VACALLRLALPVALVGCMNVEDATLPLLQTAPARREGSFAGRLEARNVTTFSGCTTPSKKNRWLILEYEGHSFPVKRVQPTELAALRADENALVRSSAPILEPQELGALGIESRSVVIDGAIAPMFYSGTVAMAPVYGIFATAIRAASR
jgi:hypothetical protein